MNARDSHGPQLAFECVNNDLNMVSCDFGFNIPAEVQSHDLTFEFSSRLTLITYEGCDKIFLTPNNHSLDKEVQRHFGFCIPQNEYRMIELTVLEAVCPDQNFDNSVPAKNFSSYQDLKAWIDDFHQKFVDAFLDILIQKKYIKPNLGRPKGRTKTTPSNED